MLYRVLATGVAAAWLVAAGVPTPKEHFGFDPGDDYKLANYAEITGYFQKLAGSSDSMATSPSRRRMARVQTRRASST